MKRARFTEEQIIGILRENEAGAKAGEPARKHGVPEGRIYAWKAKFGGMSVSEEVRRGDAGHDAGPARPANRQPLAEARRALQRRPSEDGLNRSSGGAVLAALRTDQHDVAITMTTAATG